MAVAKSRKTQLLFCFLAGGLSTCDLSQRVPSHVSSSSSSGVFASIQQNITQNLSRVPSRGNCSVYETLDLKTAYNVDLYGSLPSCTSDAPASSDQKSTSNSYNSNRLAIPSSGNEAIIYSSPTASAGKTSPLIFRDGRRASDGLMAQGYSMSISNVPSPYNSHRLYDSHIRSGLFDLENLIEEESMEKSKLSSNIAFDEGKNYQISHSVIGSRVSRKHFDFDSPHYNEFSQLSSSRGFADATLSTHSYKPDPTCYMCPIRNDPTAFNVNYMQFHKPPLQQLQHRLLHQKRQLFQKQLALESHLVHSQMMHQQRSYKGQLYKFVPSFHMIKIESGELINSHGLERTEVYPMLPKNKTHPKPSNYMKTSHINHHSQVTSTYSIPTRCNYSSNTSDP